MVSTIMKKSVGFSISVLFLFVAIVGSSLGYSREHFAISFFYPFAMTLILGLFYCIFRKSINPYSQLNKESISYILFRYSFQNRFDPLCILLLFCYRSDLIRALNSNLIAEYGTIYMIVCALVALAADSNGLFSDDPDFVESDRISHVKVFLLSLVLTPVVGYIVARMCESEQNKKLETMKLHLERAKAYREAKDYTNAILECKDELYGTDDFRKLREGTFDQREVRYDILQLLAEIYCEQGKYSEAIESYHKGMNIFPHKPHKASQCVYPIVYSEWAYKKRSIAFEALKVLDDYEERYPYEKRFTEARVRLTHNTSMGDEAEAYAKDAKAHLEQKDYASAIADYTKAIEIAPEHFDATFNKSYYYGRRAEVYRKQEDYTSAIADYTEAIKFAPEDGDYFVSKFYYYDERAQVYREQEDYASAIADYTKAIELAPEDNDKIFNKSHYYFQRAYVYREQEDYVKAFSDYTKAIELDPEHANYYGGRAEAYLEQADYEKAIADYTKAIELAPEGNSFFTKSYYYKQRGEAHQQLGNKEQAEADFAKAKELEEKQ